MFFLHVLNFHQDRFLGLVRARFIHTIFVLPTPLHQDGGMNILSFKCEKELHNKMIKQYELDLFSLKVSFLYFYFLVFLLVCDLS